MIDIEDPLFSGVISLAPFVSAGELGGARVGSIVVSFLVVRVWHLDLCIVILILS